MNILLTSVGRRKYIVEYFINALKGLGEVHTSNSVYTSAMKISHGYFISPLIYENNYIEQIISYCNNKNITAIISLFDIDLLILAKNQKRFEENSIKLILAPENSIKICNDKWATYNFLITLGISTPKTFLKIEDVTNELEKNNIHFPMIIKPRWGMASMGIYIVENIDELNILYNKCYQEIFRSYLKYESSLTKDDAIIIQEYLIGKEYGLDVINDLDGNYINTFAKWKIAMRAGETDIGKTVENTPFIDISRLLSKNIKQLGILSVDCIIQDEIPYVIELNCRISGHYPLSHLAGVDYPKQIVNWLRGEGNLELKFKTGLTITKDIVPVLLEQDEDISL